MNERKLVLYPRDPNVIIDGQAVERMLREVDFIGRSIEVVGDRRFRPGKRFARLVDFSSPGRVFDETRADPKRCTVGIPEVREEIDFLGGDNAAAPHCSCGFTFTDWSDRLDQWRSSGSQWRCECCGQEALPWNFDWNRTAAFGRYNIDVFGIDLGEAIPSPELLQELRQTSDEEWDYFYFTG